MRGIRTYLTVGCILLVLLEIASAVVLVPLTTFSISLAEVYSVVSLPSSLVIALLAGLAALVIPIMVIQSLPSNPSTWLVVNTVLMSGGLIAVIYFFENAAISFGYLGLDDSYPDGFSKSLNWAFFANLGGAFLLVVSAISASVRQFRAEVLKKSRQGRAAVVQGAASVHGD